MGTGDGSYASDPLKNDLRWTPRDARLLVSSQVGFVGIIMGSFFYGSFMPAMEADSSWSWSTLDTTHMATFANIGCSLGNFLAGPLADYQRPTSLFAWDALAICCGLALFSVCHTSSQAIAIVAMLTFMRGVTWPAANVLFVANLPRAKHDAAFISSAFGSRIGDTLGPLVVVAALTVGGLTWRGASWVLLVAVLLCFGLSYSSAPPSLKQPEAQDRLSLHGLGVKVARLASEVDGWLVLVSNTGTFAVWALYDYIGVMHVDAFHLTPGRAAGASVCISVGSALGLVFAFCGASIIGVRGGRNLQILQAALATVALAVLASMKVTLGLANVLLFLVGFGFVSMAYVPFMVYAARSRPDERGFRAAVVDGVSQVCSVGITYVYGNLRARQGHGGAKAIYSIAAGWMALATVCMAVYYQRLGAQEAECSGDGTGSVGVFSVEVSAAEANSEGRP